METSTIPLGILDLVNIDPGQTPGEAIAASITQIQAAEVAGYSRYWFAEHHNSPAIASSATAVLIGQALAATTTIKVGSGGIMLPNHAPLVVAEQFGTLAAMYPQRVELGLGRAPGTDPITAAALRRDTRAAMDFSREIAELSSYFAGTSKVRAIPGEGEDVPMYVLGSSLGGAQVAANLGLPYVFASHFAPTMLQNALQMYRGTFQPASPTDKPRAAAAVNIIVAETEQAARYAFSGTLARFQAIVTGQPGGTVVSDDQDPDELLAGWPPPVRQAVLGMLQYSFVGTASQVVPQVAEFAHEAGIEELIIVSGGDAETRLQSYRLFAQGWFAQ